MNKLLAVGLLLLVLSAWRASYADAPAAERRIVKVFLADPVGEDATLASRITSWFVEPSFEVSVERVPALDRQRILNPEREGVAYGWVSLSHRTLARLYFSMASRSGGPVTYLVRELRLEHGPDELGAERIAEVLHLSTVALLEGEDESRADAVREMLEQDTSGQPAPSGPSNAPRVPSPTPQQIAQRPREHPSRRSRSPRLDLGIGYGASVRGDEGVTHGPRVSFHIGTDRLAAGTFAQALLPTTPDMQHLSIHLYGVAARLVAEGRLPLTRSVELEGFVGGGIDVVHYAPARTLTPDVKIGSGDTEGRPQITLGTAAVLGRSFPRVAVVAEVDVALVRTHYDVVSGTTHVPVGRPYLVTPTLGLELRL